MYKAYKKDNLFILENTSTKLRASFLPSKGGMLSQLELNDAPVFYQDEENLLSDERPKCGMPILFPICGELKNKTLTVNDKNYHMSIHGFAHTNPWTVTNISANDNFSSITMELLFHPETLRQYPYKFKLEYTYVLTGRQVIVKQKIINLGEDSMTVSFGFHPYFHTPKNYTATLKLNATQAYSLQDKTIHSVNTPIYINRTSDNQSENGEMFFNVKGPVIFQTPKNKIQISFSKDYKIFVMWLPANKNCICLEPWEDIPNALNMNKGICIGPLQTKYTEIAIEIGG